MRTDETWRSSHGFSVIEVLIATAIFFILAIGLLPLFTHSMANNVAGREATEVSNFTRSRTEELLQLPFNAENMTLPAGGNELVIEEYWSDAEDAWKPGPAPDSLDVIWLRTTRIRQFAVGDLLDGTLDNPLPGSFPPEHVHLKEIEVEVRGTRNGGPLGAAKRMNVRMLRAV
ncbi:MAG TPA: prepilin-type N-terminal cleavage/methylation domain-containing protein [Thermoanaerobaculia bacterium]|nr:prepilin-type N-terminal cleavage/methylation domain-containing protein [Thermoanaerobaculia bacterium]